METFPRESSDNAIVVVMGDIGRSPRMCYHALSLASHGLNVELVGYFDSTPHEKILSNNKIRLVSVKPPPNIFLNLFRPLSLILKFFWLFFATFCSLFFNTKSQALIILMQNPPGIPTMLLCYFAAKLKNSNFIIDWHNYTFSLLSTYNNNSDSKNSRDCNLVQHCEESSFRKQIFYRYIQMAAWWEGFWGRKAHWNICVSRAMQKDLKSRWNVNAVTLYDKAPSWLFKPISDEERHNFLIRLLNLDNFKSALKRLSLHSNYVADDSYDASIFSRRDPNTGKIEFLLSRPFLLVSSTSWTPDENFNILFEALKDYDRHALSVANTTEKEELPRLLVVITGKGPLHNDYFEKFSKFHSAYVQIVTTWLAAEDYPKILSSADLGVSLHTSSSGLDLPMKVVDMFGCHLPVLAKQFEAIGELVVAGSTGILFDTHQDLKRGLIELAAGFPKHHDNLIKLKSFFSNSLQASWEEQWNASFWPLIETNLFLNF